MEIWKDIKGFEGIYQISDLGNVKGLNRIASDGRRVKGKILKVLFNSSTGYYHVALCVNGKPKTRTIHTLVAESFLNHEPCGSELVVNHINFDKSNNNKNNLEIVTTRVNSNRKHLKSSSEYTGVIWYKPRNKWMASIRISGKIKYLGLFELEIEASNAYQKALKELI